MSGGSKRPRVYQNASLPAYDDPAVKEAQEAELRANLLRRGRASTKSAGNTELGVVDTNKKVLLGS